MGGSGRGCRRPRSVSVSVLSGAGRNAARPTRAGPGAGAWCDATRCAAGGCVAWLARPDRTGAGGLDGAARPRRAAVASRRLCLCLDVRRCVADRAVADGSREHAACVAAAEVRAEPQRGQERRHLLLARAARFGPEQAPVLQPGQVNLAHPLRPHRVGHLGHAALADDRDLQRLFAWHGKGGLGLRRKPPGPSPVGGTKRPGDTSGEPPPCALSAASRCVRGLDQSRCRSLFIIGVRVTPCRGDHGTGGPNRVGHLGHDALADDRDLQRPSVWHGKGGSGLPPGIRPGNRRRGAHGAVSFSSSMREMDRQQTTATPTRSAS